MPVKYDNHDLNHLNNLDMYDREIAALYDSFVIEVAALSAFVTRFDTEKLFRFSDYPIVSVRANSFFDRLSKQIEVVIVNGILAEWTLANDKNNELSRTVFGNKANELSPEQYSRYFSNSNTAANAFIGRKVRGFNLSERVWKYTNEYRSQIELALDYGLRTGQSAAEIARDLKQYLNNPDKLFRRVRDTHGQLILSKAAKEYHPEQGVYRSSYKNALRLSRTEINIAYHTVDYERWQTMDFVVGIRVMLSNNHPIVDICDNLQGLYPKDFKFTGWHPACRCFAVAILKTESEMDADMENILSGGKVSSRSVNTVYSVPSGFTNWLKDHSSQISQARINGKLPLFLSDNTKYLK